MVGPLHVRVSRVVSHKSRESGPMSQDKLMAPLHALLVLLALAPVSSIITIPAQYYVEASLTMPYYNLVCLVEKDPNHTF